MTSKLSMIFCSLFLVVSQFVGYNAFAHEHGGINFKDAWVREAPPGVKVMAAYMTIENHTDKDAILNEVHSSSFDHIEIHKNIQKNGMASMQRQDHIVIPAQSSLNMQSAGYHMMLFNPAATLKAGESVSFSIKFADGMNSVISAKVKKATGGEHHHDHMNNENMDHEQMNHEQMK